VSRVVNAKWVGQLMNFRDQVLARLSSLHPRVLTSGFSREAAVLIPIFERQGEPHFLLTRRTEEVETHKGQISFPGGMRQDNEQLEQTALRETFEEVGIESARIEILGRFHDYISVTEYRVSPFVGLMEEPFTVMPQPSEVAEVLSVPFHAFYDPSRLRVEQLVRTGGMVDVYFYSYGTHTIWGLTARIIKDLLEELRR
jgi:8-oxo-dGTP pyrophosphatase MutT (NUDIX family)